LGREVVRWPANSKRRRKPCRCAKRFERKKAWVSRWVGAVRAGALWNGGRSLRGVINRKAQTRKV
jgi:hypothetical protein